MTPTRLIQQAFTCAALLALPLAQAAPMPYADYKAGKTQVSAQYDTDRAACTSFTANAKDVCVQEARAKEKIARAELDHALTPTVRSANKLEVTKAEAAYAVAKEKCDDLSGTGKGVCVKEAQSTKAGALAEAKLGKKVNAAITDAATDMVAAKYKLAAEKCEALAGDAKASCVVAAKAEAGMR